MPYQWLEIIMNHYKLWSTKFQDLCLIWLLLLCGCNEPLHQYWCLFMVIENHHKSSPKSYNFVDHNSKFFTWFLDHNFKFFAWPGTPSVAVSYQINPLHEYRCLLTDRKSSWIITKKLSSSFLLSHVYTSKLAVELSLVE